MAPEVLVGGEFIPAGFSRKKPHRSMPEMTSFG
jgi:hypothetical protein